MQIYIKNNLKDKPVNLCTMQNEMTPTTPLRRGTKQERNVREFSVNEISLLPINKRELVDVAIADMQKLRENYDTLQSDIAKADNLDKRWEITKKVRSVLWC